MAYWNCLKCGNNCIEGKFCSKCGEKRPVFIIEDKFCCPHCNVFVRNDMQFCPNCGKQITPMACKVCTGAHADNGGIFGRLPDGVTHIQKGAFRSCSKVYITIPPSVKYIAEEIIDKSPYSNGLHYNIELEDTSGWKIVQTGKWDYYIRKDGWVVTDYKPKWGEAESDCPMWLGKFLHIYGNALVKQ